MSQGFEGSSVSCTDGADLLTRVAEFVNRFVSLINPQAISVALWVAHTHAVAAADTTPYLNISSAEKQCGKTLLLDVLSLLVAKPWLTSSASRAVLVRKINAETPTLLLDESDAAFAGDRDYAEALRGVLNCGHSRNGTVSLCVGQGANLTFKDFQVFCPKAIAGIGRLPDTVADRSIPIRMKRRAPDETLQRFRRRLFLDESAMIRDHISEWITPQLEALRDMRPTLPNSLSARQQDGCEPLLAIADIAGGDWPERARAALVEILTGEAAEDSSTGIRLLSDIRSVFQQQEGLDRIFTVDLLAALCDMEPQWLEFNYGKALSAAALARLLKAYDIAPRKIRISDRTASGYFRDGFSDAWARYLTHRKLEQVEQSSNDAGQTQFSHVEQSGDVPPERNEESAINKRVVPCVPFCGARSEQTERRCHIHGKHASWWERTDRSHEWVCSKCHANSPPDGPVEFPPADSAGDWIQVRRGTLPISVMSAKVAILCLQLQTHRDRLTQ